MGDDVPEVPPKGIELSTGPGPRGWVGWISSSACTVAVEFYGFYIAGRLIREGGDQTLAVVLIVALVVFFCVISTMLVSAYRRSFWLEGRILWRRGVMRNRGYDLSVARIGLESARVGLAGPVVPRLRVSVDEQGPVTLWLCNRDTRFRPLPPQQLRALADAITLGREGERREAAVAAHLRQMAEAALG
ncbi:hypothetical protein [Actinomadura litoris]|uniref:hypothetical protein n=1 Tax=Actinomadura litoris TaxID=2678616 RepID=UPI001FA6D9C5|nr:hypothetical protein [Actinomadura litoris]